MSYFSYFPTRLYDPVGNNNPKLVTDIFSRIRLRSAVKKEVIMLDPYDVKEGESPEIVADKHHGSPFYHWVVMMTNGLSDVNHDWPKTTRQMQLYMEDKYGSTLYDVHHYTIFQTSGDTTKTIECNSTQAGAVAVTNYDYEIDLNEQKRSINLLRNDYLGAFIEEFKSLL